MCVCVHWWVQTFHRQAKESAFHWHHPSALTLCHVILMVGMNCLSTHRPKGSMLSSSLPDLVACGICWSRASGIVADWGEQYQKLCSVVVLCRVNGTKLLGPRYTLSGKNVSKGWADMSLPSYTVLRVCSAHLWCPGCGEEVWDS